MEFSEVLARRHMTRSFSEQPVDGAVLDRLLAGSLGGPTAGNTKGVAWVVLVGPGETAAYWVHATTEEWRRASPRFASARQSMNQRVSAAKSDSNRFSSTVSDGRSPRC